MPDGIKPLPEPMLTYKQCGLVAITQGQFHIKCSWYNYENEIEIMLFKIQLHLRDQWVNCLIRHDTAIAFSERWCLETMRILLQLQRDYGSGIIQQEVRWLPQWGILALKVPWNRSLTAKWNLWQNIVPIFAVSTATGGNRDKHYSI